jgi:hypothetical protein
LRHLFLFVSLAGLLSACSGATAATPQMIASFPAGSESSPGPINPPQSVQYVYDAYLEMEVPDVETTAGRAIDLAYQYSGYLVSSQSWQSGEIAHTSLALAVPAANFEAAYNALSQLGDLVNQRINGQWVSHTPGDGWTVYSEITLQLNGKVSAWMPLSGGWSPLRTLSSAWHVFVRIIGFLADVIIWVLVVVGPFLVIAYVLHRIVKRLRHGP